MKIIQLNLLFGHTALLSVDFFAGENLELCLDWDKLAFFPLLTDWWEFLTVLPISINFSTTLSSRGISSYSTCSGRSELAF